MEVNDAVVHPLMRSFMYGQFANLFKFALWWVTLAPLTYALLDGSTEGIGVGRIVYNAALCLMSPIGGILVERVHPKTILNRAATARFVIWCVLVPLTWLLFQSSIVTTSQVACYILLNVFLFFDGMTVGLSTVLDIDLCGVDVVANTYGIDITDEHRNQFNTRQEFFFACCFVVFAPAMAFLGLAIHKAFQQAPRGKIPPIAEESGTLIGIFFATFLVATFLQWYFFGKLPFGAGAGSPTIPGESGNESPHAQGEGGISDSQHQISEQQAGGAPGGGGEPEGPPPSLKEQLASVPGDLKESLIVICSNSAVLWRLVFLGFEIAFEDAAIVVIASQMGILLPWLGNGDSVQGNIWTSVAVAVGKFGGAIASLLMMKKYHPPEEPRKFIPIFALITLSCVVIFIFPVTVDMYNDGKIGDYAARALFLAGFLFYFFISTLPKLGLMCLFQSMVSQIENGPRVFGFIAIVATTFDASVIMILSVIFVQFDMSKALWITACIYMGHGVLELIVGPALVIRPLEKMMAANGGGGASGAEEGGGGKVDDETTSLISATPSGHIPVSARDGSGEPAAEGETGTFTQRTAAVPIATPRSGAIPMAGSMRGGSIAASHTRTAVMSVSHGGGAGVVVQRRKSNLDEPSSPTAGQQQGGGSLYYTRQGSALTPRYTPRDTQNSPRN